MAAPVEVKQLKKTRTAKINGVMCSAISSIGTKS